jgi:TrbL/VirB6 plasmid conjugal transfer protein
MAKMTLAARAAGVLIVIAAVSGIPAAASEASTTSTASAASATRAASATGAAGAIPGSAAAGLGTAAAPPVMPGTPSAPGAPQGAICDGLTIIGLGGLCQAGSSVVSSLNDLCSPGPPTPEPAGSGIDALIKPPATAGSSPGAPQKLTLYQSYGMAGQSWAPYDLKCSDMTSMIGNSVANAVFDAAKAIDRITITTYQSAAGEGLLDWLKQRVDQLITQIGNAVYFPYLAPVVLLGAIWLAWEGLIRKRASRTIEGTIWMVIACAAAIWLIGRPADFTGLGQKVSDGISQVLNAAFSRLPVSGGSGCVPVGKGDPQSGGENYAYTGGNQVVSQNADELWAVLVCKPWLAGEFGTMSASNAANAANPAGQYGRALLWSQAYAVNEKPTGQLNTQKQDVYQGIAAKLQQDPAVYPLFQGKQWATRLEIAFAGLFAALVAGALVLLIAITLIVLKLGFLLLLVAGPFFLIIGTHPGFGRVIAIRWFEMLVGVLMKQVAVALTLSVLLYCYALVMAVSDNALPWVFKIMMIALLTVAVFIYRKPFQHLFSSVGYDMLGARERAEAYREQSRYGFRGQTARTASLTLPGYATYRANRWARQNPDQADQSVFLAQSIARAAGGTGDASVGAARRGGNGMADGHDPYDHPPDDGAPGRGGPSRGGSRPGGPGLRPDLTGGNGNGRREPPPLDLQRRPRGGPPRWQPGPYPARRGGGSSVPPGAAGSGSVGMAGAPPRRQPPRPQTAAPSRPAQTPPRTAAPPPRSAPAPQRPMSADPRQATATGSSAPAAPHIPPRRSTEPETGGHKTFGRSWVRPIRRDRQREP